MALRAWASQLPGFFRRLKLCALWQRRPRRLTMDRDQVNCIHYLYQGVPAGCLTDDMLEGRNGQPPLVWCGVDTLKPLEIRGVLQREPAGLSLPMWCVSFIDQVEAQLRNMPKPDYAFGYPFSAAIRKPGEVRPAFLAISYAPAFKRVTERVLEACGRSNFHCEVTGDLASPGNIMDQVWQGIRGADAVIADLTGTNPNVMLEVGIAAALGKEVILIGEDASLPFDVRHWRKIPYDPRQLDRLTQELVKALGSVSARYPHEGKEPRF
jgi:hypothetical protein